jgi:hypothetical protein
MSSAPPRIVLFLYCVASVLARTDLARTATASASSHYDLPPYETSFLPALAIDGDDATAWSSRGEGCDAVLHLDLAVPAVVETVCARSRDMVDTTDDSVIERFDVLRDGGIARTCTLPDWRQVYCCQMEPQLTRRVSLRATRCRERAGGPGNTGFRTVQVFGLGPADAAVTDVTLIGNRNVAADAATEVQVVGSDTRAGSSDRASLVGHEARALSSDDSSLLGTDLNVTASDGGIALGHGIHLEDADFAVAVGSHLRVTVPSQVVLGSFNDASSTAKFVVAGGSAEAPLHLLEVHADGRLVNTHVSDLEARVVALERQLADAVASCQQPECDDIRVAYRVAGCCPA